MSVRQLTLQPLDGTNIRMKDAADELKQQAILHAAWGAFAAYGFRKTSMDDIARAAGMSRPALYLHYRNKEDIFRTLAQTYYDQAVQSVSTALAVSGPVSEVLATAICSQGGDLMEAMLSSPHGLELLDSSKTMASDIADTGEARLSEVYAIWLDQQAQAGRVRLDGSAQEVAATITSSLKGLKSSATDFQTYSGHVRRIAVMIGKGLEMPTG